LKKIREIEKKPSPYHPINLQVKKCPAYEKTDFINREEKNNIQKENEVFLILFFDISYRNYIKD